MAQFHSEVLCTCSLYQVQFSDFFEMCQKIVELSYYYHTCIKHEGTTKNISCLLLEYVTSF